MQIAGDALAVEVSHPLLQCFAYGEFLFLHLQFEHRETALVGADLHHHRPDPQPHHADTHQGVGHAVPVDRVVADLEELLGKAFVDAAPYVPNCFGWLEVGGHQRLARADGLGTQPLVRVVPPHERAVDHLTGVVEHGHMRAHVVGEIAGDLPQRHARQHLDERGLWTLVGHLVHGDQRVSR